LPRDRGGLDARSRRSASTRSISTCPGIGTSFPTANFDFDGRTNPRRDLRRGAAAGARDYGFQDRRAAGPVVRNEWRNGGYPAWLLERPEYGMPLHDLLEGRYPPTATLQNAHSDDAAAEWMRNATHRTTRSAGSNASARVRADADLVLAVAARRRPRRLHRQPNLARAAPAAYLQWLEVGRA
jgi:hypothetical protein